VVVDVLAAVDSAVPLFGFTLSPKSAAASIYQKK
jgi:hypothetical protein